MRFLPWNHYRAHKVLVSHNPPLTNISLLPQSCLLPDSAAAAVHCHWIVILCCLVHSHPVVLVCKKMSKTQVWWATDLWVWFLYVTHHNKTKHLLFSKKILWYPFYLKDHFISSKMIPFMRKLDAAFQSYGQKYILISCYFLCFPPHKWTSILKCIHPTSTLFWCDGSHIVQAADSCDDGLR